MVEIEGIKYLNKHDLKEQTFTKPPKSYLKTGKLNNGFWVLKKRKIIEQKKSAYLLVALTM